MTAFLKPWTNTLTCCSCFLHSQAAEIWVMWAALLRNQNIFTAAVWAHKQAGNKTGKIFNGVGRCYSGSSLNVPHYTTTSGHSSAGRPASTNWNTCWAYVDLLLLFRSNTWLKTDGLWFGMSTKYLSDFKLLFKTCKLTGKWSGLKIQSQLLVNSFNSFIV